MPEGDSLYHAAALLRPALEGQPVTELRLHRRPRHPVPTDVRIERVESIGKHLLITFDDGHILDSHLRMAGSWHLYRSGERWKQSRGAMRAVVAVPDWEAVCFATPAVELWHPRDPRERPWLRLGPDLCSDNLDLDEILRRAELVDDQTEIADVLLDQHVAAGIGNVYKSETLWTCKVDPFRPCQDVSADALVELYETASRLLRANLEPGPRRTHGRGAAVYSKAGQGCPRCHSRIDAARQGDQSRVTYWCPTCQT